MEKPSAAATVFSPCPGGSEISLPCQRSLHHLLVCSPEMEAPYSSEEEKMRLLDLYRYMHGRMHSTSRPLKLIYHVAERETLLAWVRDCREMSAESGHIGHFIQTHFSTVVLRGVNNDELWLAGLRAAASPTASLSLTNPECELPLSTDS